MSHFALKIYQTLRIIILTIKFSKKIYYTYIINLKYYIPRIYELCYNLSIVEACSKTLVENVEDLNS